jgi:hypothetical protein
MAVLGGLAPQQVALVVLSVPEPAAAEVRAVTPKALMGAAPAKAEVVLVGMLALAAHRLERVANLLVRQLEPAEAEVAVPAVGGPVAVLVVAVAA